MMPGQGQKCWLDRKAVSAHVEIVLPLSKNVGGSTFDGLDQPDQGRWTRRVSGGIAVLNLLAGPATTIPFRVP